MQLLFCYQIAFFEMWKSHLISLNRWTQSSDPPSKMPRVPHQIGETNYSFSFPRQMVMVVMSKRQIIIRWEPTSIAPATSQKPNLIKSFVSFTWTLLVCEDKIYFHILYYNIASISEVLLDFQRFYTSFSILHK